MIRNKLNLLITLILFAGNFQFNFAETTGQRSKQTIPLPSLPLKLKREQPKLPLIPVVINLPSLNYKITTTYANEPHELKINNNRVQVNLKKENNDLQGIKITPNLVSNRADKIKISVPKNSSGILGYNYLGFDPTHETDKFFENGGNFEITSAKEKHSLSAIEIIFMPKEIVNMLRESKP